MYRRKTDLMVSNYVVGNENPEEVLQKIVDLYTKLNSFMKSGYKIVAYKEKMTTYEMKNISIELS